MKQNKNGFSLVELLVVVVIMGIIGAIGSTTYARHLSRGRDQQRLADLAQIAAALERYRSEHGQYPSPDMPNCDTSIGAPISQPSGNGGCGGGIANETAQADWASHSSLQILETEGYIDHLPLDPINSREHYYGFDLSCGSYTDGNSCGRQGITCGGENVCCAFSIGVRLEDGSRHFVCDGGITSEL